jgi:hypothetical protein
MCALNPIRRLKDAVNQVYLHPVPISQRQLLYTPDPNENKCQDRNLIRGTNYIEEDFALSSIGCAVIGG